MIGSASAAAKLARSVVSFNMGQTIPIANGNWMTVSAMPARISKFVTLVGSIFARGTITTVNGNCYWRTVVSACCAAPRFARLVMPLYLTHTFRQNNGNHMTVSVRIAKAKLAHLVLTLSSVQIFPQTNGNWMRVSASSAAKLAQNVVSFDQKQSIPHSNGRRTLPSATTAAELARGVRNFD